MADLTGTAFWWCCCLLFVVWLSSGRFVVRQRGGEVLVLYRSLLLRVFLCVRLFLRLRRQPVRSARLLYILVVAASAMLWKQSDSVFISRNESLCIPGFASSYSAVSWEPLFLRFHL